MRRYCISTAGERKHRRVSRQVPQKNQDFVAGWMRTRYSLALRRRASCAAVYSVALMAEFVSARNWHAISNRSTINANASVGNLSLARTAATMCEAGAGGCVTQRMTETLSPGYQICGGRKHGYSDKGKGEPSRYSKRKQSANGCAGALQAYQKPPRVIVQCHSSPTIF